MPRSVAVLLVLTACCAVAPAMAQRKELTLLAGGTLTGASSGNLEHVQARPGFVAGLSVRLPRAARFSLETQALVIQRRLFGQRPPTTQPPLQAGPLADAANLWYIEVPILLRFQQGYSMVRPLRPYLTLGPYVGVRLGCTREITEQNGTRRATDCSVNPGNSTGFETFLPAVYQEVDLGLLGGVGIEIHQFSVGARFERSLRNLVEPGGGVHTSPFDGARLWTALVSVEYLIRVL
jgi:hypothetical protein